MHRPMGYLCLSVSMPAYMTPPKSSSMMWARPSAFNIPCRAPTNTVLLRQRRWEGQQMKLLSEITHGMTCTCSTASERVGQRSGVRNGVCLGACYSHIFAVDPPAGQFVVELEIIVRLQAELSTGLQERLHWLLPVKQQIHITYAKAYRIWK